MAAVVETTWRIEGLISDADLKWLSNICHSCVHYRAEDIRSGCPFFTPGQRPLVIHTIVTTISDRQESLLMLKFIDSLEFYGKTTISPQDTI